MKHIAGWLVECLMATLEGWTGDYSEEREKNEETEARNDNCF